MCESFMKNSPLFHKRVYNRLFLCYDGAVPSRGSKKKGEPSMVPLFPVVMGLLTAAVLMRAIYRLIKDFNV